MKKIVITSILLSMILSAAGVFITNRVLASAGGDAGVEDITSDSVFLELCDSFAAFDKALSELCETSGGCCFAGACTRVYSAAELSLYHYSRLVLSDGMLVSLPLFLQQCRDCCIDAVTCFADGGFYDFTRLYSLARLSSETAEEFGRLSAAVVSSESRAKAEEEILSKQSYKRAAEGDGNEMSVFYIDSILYDMPTQQPEVKARTKAADTDIPPLTFREAKSAKKVYYGKLSNYSSCVYQPYKPTPFYSFASENTLVNLREADGALIQKSFSTRWYRPLLSPELCEKTGSDFIASLGLASANKKSAGSFGGVCYFIYECSDCTATVGVDREYGDIRCYFTVSCS